MLSRWSRAFVLASMLGAVTTTFAFERDARACGGCFAPPGPSTQVNAHQMAFAVSPKRTILWDQIQYVGSPSSFGWVLPIRDKVDVGISSDAFFQRLEQLTAPQIQQPPPPACPDPERRCRTCGGMSATDESALPPPTKGGVDAGVEVWSTTVVGPYEATQLSATDGTALANWLKDHGYVLPDAIVPVVDQYIKEGFGFLAIKLVPTADTSKMVPIRIAFDGASPTLPLRMVAAGTGANVGIKLWVLGEGRWETKNFPSAEIATKDLVWDFRAMGSNFGTLESAIITKDPKSWITETADDQAVSTIVAGLSASPTGPDGKLFSVDSDETELGRAFPGRPNVLLTRMFAQLPQSALGTDLELQASLGDKIPVRRMPPNSVNYTCPSVVYEGCCDGFLGCSTSPTSSDTPPAPSGPGRLGTFGWLGLSIAGLFAAGIARKRLGT